jgi:predicted O-linked N-acetylglucosamine transferase (SPINDLY family)
MTQNLLQQALALHQAGRLGEAEPLYRRALAATPGDWAALHLVGALCLQQGRHDEALALIEAALTARPDAVESLRNLAIALDALGRKPEALAALDRALALQPGDVEIRNNRGRALQALNRAEDALAEFDRVTQAAPNHVAAWVNRAGSLWALGRIDEALAAYDRALAIAPDQPQALQSRGELLWSRRKALAPAIADLERALTVAPDLPYLEGNLLQLKMYAADWRGFADAKAHLDAGVRAGKPVAQPFVYQGLSASPSDLLACATTYARTHFPPRPAMQDGKRRDGRIRIGYVSGEFRAQATAWLAAGLYEAHDRSRFEVIAFDNGASDHSAMRARLERGFDRMVDIAALSDHDAAQRVLAEDVDILVNLNGWFGNLRMGLFALRPAAIQVNYLGFPGTLGAPYMDYILADRVVIPDGEQRFYSEQVVWLPHSYQVNDDKRAMPAPPPPRAALGLPESGFVFCHFNAGYKITPDMFAIWMRLLAQVDGSVLWLLEGPALFAENLRCQAAQHGVDPARLVFAPSLPLADHLARLGAGDLFLDSTPSGAHTTASDALWAGLPLLTCRGTAFAGRVGASLLTAIGLPDLVVEKLADYESLALALARDPARLAAVRARLAANRSTTPLFDTARTTRAIESAYQQMFDRWQRGEAPAGFAVTE